ncbi:uncharacterized protein C17orf113 [Latimeria chalumnae]|uniref:uncharacterized protein C17orf113 n=1 Tax=Latimeria chalumnae TaxID=7897 RepID=UPI0003C10E9D|nr:PREDICTED: zinc finger protein 385C [Latimeria chalumnae]XP_014350288.1 PREDICTED: zinc finger protein 385C [Latimeria chalumnae]|eukprot:XP_006006434.1 PREDICTED: zinc finger protein 385C [Latimeria chalumnae]
MVPPGKKPAGAASNSNKKCKRYFNEHWKEEFTWLEFDYDKRLMFCAECRQALVKNKHGKADNAFTVGTDNFQRHALLRHVTSGAHRQALAVNMEQLALEPPVANHQEIKSIIKMEVDPSKVPIMTTVYWMAKEQIPDEKCASLLELQKFNHCQALLTAEQHDCYQQSNVKDIQAAIVKVLHNEDRQRMEASPFIGLVVDETVDIMEHKNLVLFSTAVSPCDGQTTITFLGSYELPVVEAHTVVDKVVDVVRALDVPLMKISWLSSDGSSLMADRLNGVGTKLKPLCPVLMELHCVCHKSALLPADMFSAVEYIKKYEETVDAVYRLYSNFEAENNSLQELQKVLNLYDIRLEGPKTVHWTSISPAVEAIDSLWPTLVLLLEGESEKSPVALGLCEELKKFHFVAFTKLLLDVLQIFQKLCRFFQIEDLDFSMVKPIVTATVATLEAQKNTTGQNFQEFLNEMNEHPREDVESESRFYYKGVELTDCSKANLSSFEHLKETYLESVCGNLQDRFPNSVLDVINCFSTIFNPKVYPQSLDDVGHYGNDELNFLLHCYSHVIISERAMNDFPLFKRIVFSLNQLSFRDLCVKLVYTNSEMHELFPDFATLAAIALTLPVGSVLYEKISRAKERMKWSQRGFVKQEGLSNVVKIAVDGPTINEFDFLAAVEHFETMRTSQGS